jgi:hypothetical protein
MRTLWREVKQQFDKTPAPSLDDAMLLSHPQLNEPRDHRNRQQD